MHPWVLVVDDDQATRETLRLLLEDAECKVTEAPDGQVALDQLRGTPQSMIVLLDLMMPKMDGAAVLSVVAADPDLARRHAYVLLTAMHQPLTPDVEQMVSALGCSVVEKPFDIDALLNVVTQAEQRLP